jgi:hypothetical protein
MVPRLCRALSTVIIGVALPTDHNAEMIELRSQRSDGLGRLARNGMTLLI